MSLTRVRTTLPSVSAGRGGGEWGSTRGGRVSLAVRRTCLCIQRVWTLKARSRRCCHGVLSSSPEASRSCLMDQTMGKSTRQQHTMSTKCRMFCQLHTGGMCEGHMETRHWDVGCVRKRYVATRGHGRLATLPRQQGASHPRAHVNQACAAGVKPLFPQQRNSQDKLRGTSHLCTQQPSSREPGLRCGGELIQVDDGHVGNSLQRDHCLQHR